MLSAALTRLDHACLRRRRFRSDPMGHRRTEGQIRQRALDVRGPGLSAIEVPRELLSEALEHVRAYCLLQSRRILRALLPDRCGQARGTPIPTSSAPSLCVLRKARSSRSLVRRSRSSAGGGSSRFFRSSRPATSRSPRRRLPLRSRTCSADPPRPLREAVG